MMKNDQKTCLLKKRTTDDVTQCFCAFIDIIRFSFHIQEKKDFNNSEFIYLTLSIWLLIIFIYKSEIGIICKYYTN